MERGKGFTNRFYGKHEILKKVVCTSIASCKKLPPEPTCMADCGCHTERDRTCVCFLMGPSRGIANSSPSASTSLH